MRQRLFRFQEIERARTKLELEGFPRAQMSFLVMLTGLAGFLASYCLLQWGVNQMWLRYLEATVIAYLAFLFLLWLWLRTSASDFGNAPDISGLLPRGGGNAEPMYYAGKGGQFDGGGASGDFDANFSGTFHSTGNADALAQADSPIGEALGAASQAEEFSIPLIVLVLIGAACLSSFLVIYSAPVLFAELMVDGVLAASLYRRMRGLETRHWLSTAVRRTFLPFAMTGVFAAMAGWAMKLYVPHAQSLGTVLLHAGLGG